MIEKIVGFQKRYIRKESAWQKAGLLTGILAFVWWCVLYPELCFPQDAYEAVYETEVNHMEAEENNLITESCRGLLRADEEQVIVKSRLFEWLEQYIE